MINYKMRQLKYTILLLFVLVLSMNLCSALDVERTFRLSFDHLLYMSNISTMPSQIYPGQEAILNFKIENTGNQFIRNVRIDLEMPAEFAPYKDIDKRKIAQMLAGDSENISFSILPLPQTEDGVYKLNIIARYVNYIGDEREENSTIGIFVGSSPKPLVEFSSSDIYQGNSIGNVKLKVINNNVGNVKFLKVDLAESNDYTIIGSNINYIGDLNSDDFSEVTFRINLKKSVKIIDLPVTLYYKDALNKDYTRETKIEFKVPTASEAGIKKSYGGFIFVIIVLGVIGYIFYKRYNKKILKQKKALMSNFSTKF